MLNDEDQSIEIPNIHNAIYKIKITENEYFLIENRNNKIIQNPIFSVLDEDEYTLDDLSYYLNCDPINPNTEETNLHCDESVQNDLRELFGEKANIYNEDFLEAKLPTFNIIIGNPPFNSNGLKKVPTNIVSNKQHVTDSLRLNL